MNAWNINGLHSTAFARHPALRESDDAIVGDSAWLPQGFDQRGTEICFVRLSREGLRGLPFLTDHALRAFRRRNLPIHTIERALVNTGRSPTHYIFHTAFCGSTLLVRALEAMGVGAAIKEPGLLTDLAYWVDKVDDESKRRRITLTTQLLGRPIDGDRPNLVKSSCFANSLAPSLLDADRSSRALFLCGSLQEFLLAIVKRGIRGRTWARQAYANAAKHTPIDFRFTSRELLELTDLQIAGLAWLMRSTFLRRAATTLGHGRVRIVESGNLFDAPDTTLVAAAEFLGGQHDHQLAERIVTGPVFSRHSKQIDRPFDPAGRALELKATLAANREEIDIIAQWVEAVGAGFGLEAWPNAPRQPPHQAERGTTS